MGFILGWIVAFIIGVAITRWVFGIEKILNSLETQNKQGLIQIRLLKKMLINQGVPEDEIDIVIEKGNPKKNATEKVN